jgi:hypothetical protein
MKRKIHYCKNCGNELKKRQKIYCNTHCQKEVQYKRYIERWKQGLETGLSGKYQISEHIRRYLKDKYGNKCSKCGWYGVNPVTNKVPLEIEHIDGNYLNNNEDNLDLLCPNCHSLTPTYRALNKGNGRKDRRKYDL